MEFVSSNLNIYKEFEGVDQKDILITLEKDLDSVESRIKELDEIIEKEKKESKENYHGHVFSQVARDAKKEKMRLEPQLLKFQNQILSVRNGGSLYSFKDHKGGIYRNIPDFSEIDADDILFTPENIHEKGQPHYIPYVDEDRALARSYVFDSIRIDKDRFLVSTSAHVEIDGDEVDSNYFIINLDKLVLTSQYYEMKRKGDLIEEAERKNQRNLDHWDNLPEERKSRFLMQSGIYFSLPAKIKKEISREDYEELDWKEREKIYKFYKRYKPRRTKKSLRSDKMPTSLHKMYERFVDPTATIRVEGRARYGNPKVFEYWNEYNKLLKYKLIDIKIQRDDLSETYRKGMETSFGALNSDDALYKDYGVFVKNQDGSKINNINIDQIKSALIEIQKYFGNLKEAAKDNDLRISHTQDTLVFASRAAGMYIPRMNAIAVTNKFGSIMFQTILSHELAHFIDNKIGESQGYRYSTDNYESVSGKIAFNFRDNLNVESESDYINSTKECFARAFEQYFAVKAFGDDVMITYSYGVSDARPFFEHPNYVNKENFEKTIQPLIEEFFDQYKEFFKFNVVEENDMESKAEDNTKKETQKENKMEKSTKSTGNNNLIRRLESLRDTYKKSKSVENRDKLIEFFNEYIPVMVDAVNENQDDSMIKPFFEANNTLPDSKKHSGVYIFTDDLGGDYIEKPPKPIWDYIPQKAIDRLQQKRLEYKLEPKNENLGKIMMQIAGTDDLRPLMMGMNFDKNGVISTDAHKMMFLHGDVDEKYVGKIYKPIQELKKDYKKFMKGLDTSTKEFTFDDYCERYGSMEGKYPNVKGVIPNVLDNDKITISLPFYASVIKTIIDNGLVNQTTKAITFKINQKDGETYFISLNGIFFYELAKSLIAAGFTTMDFSYTPLNNHRVIIFIPKGYDGVIVGYDGVVKTTFGLLMPVMTSDTFPVNLEYVSDKSLILNIGESPSKKLEYSDIYSKRTSSKEEPKPKKASFPRKKKSEKPDLNYAEKKFLKEKIEAFEMMLEIEEVKSEQDFLKEKIEAFEMMLEIS